MHLYILYFLSQFSWVVPDPAVPLVLPLRFLVPLVLSLSSHVLPSVLAPLTVKTVLM